MNLQKNCKSKHLNKNNRRRSNKKLYHNNYNKNNHHLLSLRRDRYTPNYINDISSSDNETEQCSNNDINDEKEKENNLLGLHSNNSSIPPIVGPF